MTAIEPKLAATSHCTVTTDVNAVVNVIITMHVLYKGRIKVSAMQGVCAQATLYSASRDEMARAGELNKETFSLSLISQQLKILEPTHKREGIMLNQQP